MKSKTAISVILPMLLVVSFNASAQRFDSLFRAMPYFDKYYGGGAMISVPLSNRSFLAKPTVRSGGFFYREMLNDRVSAGFDVSFAGYDDYTPPKLYESANSAVYTDFYNYVNRFTVAVAGDYLFRPEGKVIPFAGAGLGASYTSVRIYYNIYDDRETKWSVSLTPHAGALFRFGTRTSWGAFASAGFDYSFLTMPNFDYKGFGALSLQAGLVYMDW